MPTPDAAFEIAEREIARVKRDNLRVLPLDDMGLTSIPELLRELTQVDMLILSGNKLTELPDWIGELAKLKTL